MKPETRMRLRQREKGKRERSRITLQDPSERVSSWVRGICRFGTIGQG
jgi:hypothetical protein